MEISNYKLVLENCSFQYCLLTDVNIAHSDVNTDALFIYQNSMVVRSVLDCETPTDILNTICNRDC